MNLPMIQMDPDAARREFEAFREAVRASAEHRVAGLETRAARRRAEMEEADLAILAGYRQLTKGKPIIDLRTAISAGGQDATGRPRIAVCRADDAAVSVRVWPSGRTKFSPIVDRVTGWELEARSATRVFDFLDLFPDQPARPWVTSDAKAPYIPPALRPAGSLDRYHLLWEAEWTRVVPRDPALLRHLGAGLYLVLATWDLTDLEATVLSASGA